MGLLTSVEVRRKNLTCFSAPDFRILILLRFCVQEINQVAGVGINLLTRGADVLKDRFGFFRRWYPLSNWVDNFNVTNRPV